LGFPGNDVSAGAIPPPTQTPIPTAGPTPTAQSAPAASAQPGQVLPPVGTQAQV
jgi:hypothetical protein